MQKVSLFDFGAIAALWIGGINWGIIGLFHFNLLEKVFGSADGWVARLVYTCIGIAALYLAISSFVKESRAPNLAPNGQERLPIA